MILKILNKLYNLILSMEENIKQIKSQIEYYLSKHGHNVDMLMVKAITPNHISIDIRIEINIGHYVSIWPPHHKVSEEFNIEVEIWRLTNVNNISLYDRRVRYDGSIRCRHGSLLEMLIKAKTLIVNT